MMSMPGAASTPAVGAGSTGGTGSGRALVLGYQPVPEGAKMYTVERTDGRFYSKLRTGRRGALDGFYGNGVNARLPKYVKHT